MGSPRPLGSWPALAAVVAGVSLFTLGLLGMDHVDSRLEVAATAQQAAAAKHKTHPPRERKRAHDASSARAHVRA